MKEEIKEIIRLLRPDNTEASAREFAATLRIVVANTPMRALLKAIIGHMGYWSCEQFILKGVDVILVKEKKKKTDLKGCPRTRKKEGIDNV